ncbi:MAG: helix-turn-helix transcriptional regulator [Clostridiales bacterium]|nr:helix-turn-helix transcriptional regulator [Clostridiales bacterium]
MNVEIANKLVTLRKQLGLSQEGLAEKIGVSRQAVSKWERSESSPDTENLIALSRIYGISIDEMLNYDINTNVTEKASTNSESFSYSDLDDSGIYNDDSKDEDGDKDTYSVKSEVDKKNLRSFPIAILATIIYLFLGIVFNLWHPGWLIFLTIPVFHVFASPRKKGERWKSLPYPIICTIIFLLLGFLFDGWYYAWLIFLTIPLWAYFIKG